MKKPMRELRELSFPVELRVADDGKATLLGYAAVFADDSEESKYRYGNIVEMIAPGAFARAIRDRQDVRALYNHDPAQLLGRVSSTTLRLSEDTKGLRYEIDLPDTTLGHDVKTLVERGDLSGSSFAFRIKSEKWERVENSGAVTYNRTIQDVDLIDVGPVTFPAYSGTQATMRSEDIEAMEAQAEALTKSEAEGDSQARSEEEEKRRSEEAEILELKCKMAELGL